MTYKARKRDKNIFMNQKSKKMLYFKLKTILILKIKLQPFFNDYPIQGIKSLDFADFKKVAEIIKNKDHLTDKGFNEIKKMVDGMNLDRNKV